MTALQYEALIENLMSWQRGFHLTVLDQAMAGLKWQRDHIAALEAQIAAFEPAETRRICDGATRMKSKGKK